ncbi:non-ribosomal peptide synthetase [Pyxidicoccus trucidator]|uniref:non-ribosomal peptide synthetase n=1 Tax=Pyxidicoccus trucidator TaxID=2709662 RepID=UPI0013DB7ED8|nr:non-ribosomal peptide synthase/polyketide synthase [Pyxidicoccus trucidator]
MKNVEDIYRLSPMQQGLLFHTVGAPGEGTYVEVVHWSWRGVVDLPTLQRAWQRLVDRHTSLRTAFFWENMKEPLQAVRRKVEATPRLEDCSDLPSDAWEARFAEVLEREARQDFALSAAPLLRLTLVRFGPTLTRCIISYHHLVMDGWSLPVCLRELFLTYDALTRGEEPSLEPVRPYRDYIVWLSKQERDEAARFWRERLRGFTSPTPLAMDRPARAEAKAETYAAESLGLGTALTARLTAFTRQHQVTLSTLLQGAWALLQSRYTGQDDVAFGTVVSGRPPALPGVDTMLGTFINTQVTRVRLPDGSTVLPWLKGLQGELLAARAHEHVSLVDVQGWSEVPRGQALFDTLVVFENMPRRGLSPEMTARLPVDGFGRTEGRTGYPLIFTVLPDATEMEVRFTYDVSRFDTATPRRMLGHISTLLQSLVDAPEAKLADLSMMSPDEVRRLADWNGSRDEYPRGDTLHARFSRQAALTPAAIALVSEAGELSYAELERRANQLARHLHSVGVRPGACVALCLERSEDLIVALLAILKAGGAYVPLDPSYPAERLSLLLQQSGAGVLVTRESLADELPALSCLLVLVDSEAGRIASQPDTALSTEVGAEALAYVMFTSGSTGQPKGVCIPHRGVLRLVTDNPFIRFGPEEVFLQLAPSSFDASTLEVWGALLHGARLVLAPARELSLEDIGALLRRHDVSTLWLTAALFEQMVIHQGEALARVSQLLAGGDVLPAQRVREHLARLPEGAVLVNGYGPTENTTFSATHAMRRGDTVGASVPIGRPLGWSTAYVLDAALRPVPPGLPGELYVGGEGLAWGYLGRADLTAEKFVPHPFGVRPGERLYRTGDKARWRADGALEFLGRTDFQVKVRGFRIETGEVEAVLRQAPGVQEAVVVVREDLPGHKRLVAYVVGPALEPRALRAFLEQKLPEYMVPSAFAVLESLPLTAHGKVDRKALPAPEHAQAASEEVQEGPRDATETALAAIWAQVLGRPSVGVHEDFFELGGDSILGIQVLARAAQAGLHLTAKQLFELPTVAQLAAVAGTAPAVAAEQGLVTGRVELTPIQRWFLDREPPAPHHFNQALRLTLRERIPAEVLERALQHLREHHDALRLGYTRDGQGAWRQEVRGLDGALPLLSVDVSGLSPEARAAAGESHAARAQAGLELASGGVARAVLFDAGPDAPQELLLVIHHLVVDAVSWRVLVEDLHTACQQLRAGTPVRLPPKTLSFAGWASRMVEHARTSAARAEEAFWLGLPWERAGRLPVDLDGSAEANTEGDARVVEVSLEPGETQALLQEVARACCARPDELLLAALARVMRRWTGAPCVRLELEGHGREALFEGVDLSRTVGWFTSLYPVLVDEVGEGPGAWLRSAKESLRRIPGKGVGFGVLRYLAPYPELRERLRALPECEVGFNYLGQLDHVLPAGALLSLSDGPVGPKRAPGAPRAHLLEVDCAVSGGRLRLMFAYGSRVHRRETVERWAGELVEALRELIALGTSGEARGLTPSDFPLAGLGQAALDSLTQVRLADVEDLYPLSPLQEGILLHHLRDDGGTQPYFNQLTFALEGELDTGAFTQAWRQVVSRYTILRTAFLWEGLDRPLQAVVRELEPPITVEDRRDVPPSEQEAWLNAFFAEDRRRGVALARAPLHRLAVLRMGERSWRVVLSFSHILLDGWSIPLVLRELLTRFEALRRGLPPPRMDTRPYRDFIAWLGRRDLGATRDFWRKSLEGFTEPTPLEPGGSELDAGLAGVRGELRLGLGAEKTAVLQSFARQQGVTPGTLVQAAWALLLGRYSGRDDVLFGVTVSGRPSDLPGVEEMVGMFINAIPARVRLPPRQSVGAWLKTLQGWLMEARQHEHAPLVEVRRWSDIPPGPPLFESLVVFENYPVDTALTTDSKELVVRDARSLEADHHPLTLTAMPGRELLLQLAYDTTRFGAAAIQRMMAHLHTLLMGLAEGAARPLAELPMLAPEERRQLLEDFRGPREAYPRELSLHALIEAQVARTPDAEALRFEGETLTYAQLDARANQLAWHLRSLGVGPESLVGVCLERSLEMVVALLGVLKSGAAYVPMDPAYPRERLAWMLEDTAAPVLLTSQRLVPVLPPHSARVVCLDSQWPDVALHPASRPAPLAGPEALAYVIFTSGSTGRPKGAMNAHAGVVNRLLWMQQEYGLTAADTVLQKTPFSFDVSVWEFFWPLMTGARLVLARPGGHQDPAYLVRLMADERVTTTHFVPSMLRAFVEEPGLEGLTALRHVVCSGEALPADLVRRAYARLPTSTAVHNLYGPTEAAVDVTYWPCPREDSGREVPIGRPVANTRIHVLDAHGQPTPVGVPGELFIGGVQVGRGYWSRPSLTAERFIPDAFSEVPGARLYRTGDKARWRADGTLEYLGRVDTQVKLRGFRIELGEVESALRAHPDVADSVVVVREDGPSGARLVAYLVPTPSATLDTQSLRASLAQRLPEYMVPSAFVLLPALPLSPSGKVDRKALPAPESPTVGYVGPRTPMEELLARVFAQVLGVERVSVTESFFELGGHSLLATQVASRVRAAAGVDLPLRELFDSPTAAGLAARVEALSRSSQGTALAPPLRPAPRTGPLPLSFAQQRLWFLDRLEPGSPFYNMPSVLWLEGTVDVGALERSIAELLRRHEVLRTTFEEGPVQVIHPPAPVSLAVVDLSTLPEDSREAEARRLAREEARRPFDLTRGPLLRAMLLRLGESSHLLSLTLHHIVSDGWSMEVLVREAATLYSAFREGQPSPLPELPVQYADYAAWQRDWLQGDVLEGQLSWWRNHLADAPPLLELPTDFPRPTVRSLKGARHARVLPRSLADSLQALSRREGTTLFMALLAGFQVVLSRYSGQDDFVVGTDIANRNHSQTEGLIGFFINQLPLRARLDGDLTFRELLGRVRQTSLGAYAHQDLPFEELVKALNPERSQGHAPLFQVKLVLQNQPASTLEVSGLTLRGETADVGTSRLDLTLSVEETARGLECSCEYRTDLFEAATIDRLMRHLGRVLEAGAARPESRLSALPLLSEDEQRQVLVDWNATERDFPRDACAHQLFAAQAALTPSATAVRFEGQALTYSQLDTRANQLAHHLRTLGVRAEVPVALCVERSLELVVGILGILKAGGAYVPLDPSYPVERLTYMLRDCAAPVLVTTETIADELPAGSEQLVLLDADGALIASQPETPFASGTGADNLAYIIYTSGSTGRPKGTLLQHRGLCNTALTAAREHGFRPDSHVLQYAAFGFDASVAEIFGALLAGSTLVLAPRERLMPGAPLRTLLRDEAITAVTLTPSVLAQMEPEDFPALQTLISAGEACTPELVERWGNRVRLLNAYGPTEVTVCATLSEPMKPGQRISIGRPWANVRVYVLDAALRPVPVGVPGELCVDSVGLARGYRHQPELTAERFVPNPFSATAGARLYRTGDKARWLADGTLEYLGRIDQQVKLRGFRIELGEVESVLAQQPSVREAVAVVREDAPGDKRLVAYVVAEDGDMLDTAALRTALKQRLPEHMVPAVISVLDALPLTPNGKVDRAALPSPDTALASQTREYVAPRTPREEQLAAMWAELLHVELVGIHDDFFELGGHSLLATQVVSRIRTTLGVELSLGELFTATTVAALAERLGAMSQGATQSIPRASRTGPLPLSFAQQRLWFLDQLEPGGTVYNVPGVMRLEGALDAVALQRSLDALMQRHEVLRTTFQQGPDGPIQVIAEAASCPFEQRDLSHLPVGERDLLVRQHIATECERPFDLARGPLFRVVLLRLRAEEHVLLVLMHHIASDGWSTGVLMRDLTALYPALAAGKPSPLPALPIQYADYALWQREWLRGEVLDTQLGYWKQQLLGAPQALELPTDLPRPAVKTFHGASVPVQLPRELSAAVRTFSQEQGVTPFMALLGAFQVLMARYSGQQDIVVGSPIAGRRFSELEDLVGFFVNTLALRLRLEDGPSFQQVVARVREGMLGAQAHQDVPFERLVESLASGRSLERDPLFQVFFTLQNTPTPLVSATGLSLRPIANESTTAKFDLELAFSESPDGFTGSLIYNTDLFLPATARRLARHYVHFLEALLGQPSRPFHRLPLLPEDELRTVLSDFNRAPADFPRDATLPEVFSRIVALHGDRVALEFGAQRLTYRQLDARANQLAHLLVARGVGPDVPVALALERSVELIVSLLAILKAGGAYLPLDTSYPPERLAQMVEDARPVLLLTHSATRASLPSSLPVLHIDEAARALDSQPEHAPPVALHPEHLAYIDFTSGSTGRPKGVAVSHRNVLRTVREAPYADVSADHSFLLIAPISFDASTLEVWGPLLNGGRLVVFPPDSPSDLDLLSSVLSEHSVSTLHLTAGLFSHMVDNRLDGLKSVKQLLTGGDVVSAPHVRRVLEQLGIPVTACYGPTEGTLFTSCFRMTSPEQVPASIPIGTPITATQVYLLDSHGHPVPVGVPGELFIGGEGLARGYVRNPAQTAERFVPHPFSREPGARLYRTGDLARWRPDGVLEFLGRGDFQVKIRGFRIELAEVEAALLSFPGVREAVALAREDVPGDKRLVGYVTADATLDLGALRDALEARLPEYMVPSALVRLDALPLTANAKVDRKALPAPDSRSELRAFEPPRTPTEQRLAALWADVLRVDRVGLHDGFFELGGHSLLATQLVSRVRAAFDVELPLRELFESPTVAGLATRLEALARASAGIELAPPLRTISRTESPPLSFGQQRLWFLDQLQPGTASYNVPGVLHLDGELDTAALEQALRALVQRHEVLRTTFQRNAGVPTQLIHPQLDTRLPTVDLLAVPPEARETETRRLASEEALRPFDLERGPLLRTQLLRLGPTQHHLLVTLHHIVSDGWSINIMLRELGALYRAFSSGHPLELPSLPVQYADFAAWQRQWIQGDVLQAQLDWWREQLAGVPALLELPTDRPRPALQSHQGASLDVRLPPALSRTVEEAAQRHGATPFMVLLAAWQLLLSRYSGQDDIVVGSPIAGRNRAETEGLIGFFVNTLVLRARIDPRAGFSALLEGVKASALAAYEHQDVPFERLVEELRPERSLSHSPLFQVMFTLQNAPLDAVELPGLRLRLGGTPSPITKFDLSLTLQRAPEGFAGELEYNTDLFDASTVERMDGHFQVLLEAVLARPEQPLSLHSPLTAAEREQLMVEWNATAVDFPSSATVHQLLEEQARRTPLAMAVEAEGSWLTYGELHVRAALLARQLRSLGVGPEVRVGLCVERSTDMVVGLLAVLKAGGAYVPLDPDYPRERLAFMLQDCGAPVLLTSRSLSARLPPGPVTVFLDGELEALSSGQEAPTAAFPESPAYVLFTSGTTGLPKGTVVSHRALANHLTWMVRWLGVAPGDRALQLASLSFDASVAEVLSTLLAGATLVLPPPGAHRDPAAVAELLARERITLLQAVPSMLRALLEQPALAHATALRAVVSGGEALPTELVPRLGAQLPGARLFNHYGPTEATIDATACVVSGEQPGALVSIGKPVANTRAYVLDAGLRPVPTGVPGELYLGGVSLARGYLGRPELTAEKFLPDPFASEPGARLYRTGDKARWRADGTLEYLGRVDMQVKLRGFRIELGEVESAIRAHPDVADSVVVVREDGPSGARLVAYLVPTPSATLDTQSLRASLAQRLPEYMVPSAFVVLSALPLSPSGKVDRKALPAPEAPTGPVGEYVAPRTPTEELLARIFAEVLGMERVSVTEGFFELGGHSLLATQVASRVRATADVELPLRELFESPTVAGLAARVEALSRSSQGSVLAPPLRPAPRTGPLPLSFAQQRLWFLDRLEPNSPFYNMPSVLWLEGTVDVGALERSIAELLRRHEVLRTTFEEGPVQVIHPPAPVPLAVVDLSTLPEDQREAEARRLAQEEARRPFDLTRGPMLRAMLLRLGESRHLLSLTLHHIATDGWSMEVLVREAATLYAAFRNGQPSPLPELPVQYADYAAWQRGWLQGDVLDAQLSWWREHLSGAPSLLELPTDFPRPTVRSLKGAMHTRVLPRALADSLQAFSQREGTTLFMALLAGFQVVLSRYSGQDDFVVGTDIANRNHSQTEGLIGFFINQLPLRARLDGDPSFRELLGRVRQTSLGAYAHQDLPFEELVKALNPERSQGHAPLFQVKLVLQNQPASTLEVPGLTLRGEPIDAGTSRLDLTLAVAETPEGLGFSCEYRTDLFEAATIDRLVQHLGRVLEAGAARPESRLSALPLLSEDEQRQVLVDWNATERDFPRDACAHQLFAAQAALTPDATAVRFEGQALTYSQLDTRANQLAHHLRALGVRAEVPVALCVERSLELVVGILGILKAGGAYVPLDPSYPLERLTYMLRDCAAPVLVTTEAIADTLPSGGEQLVLLDAEAPLLAGQPLTAPEAGVLAQSLAYIIYTSGSTGRPKGTLLQHRGLCNTALTAVREHGFRSDSRVLQYAALGFDASVAEIFGALLAGATLVLAPRERLMPGAPLRTLLHEESITAVTLTPSVMAQLAPEDAPSLETLISAGEACTPELVERWGGRVRLLNAYGPTEVTVCATLSEPLKPGQRLTIGRPWANVRVYVLDAALRPLPVGVPGELCVDSVGLARGYRHQADLTAERFVPNPFSDVLGARLYRTGDKVRWLADGTLEYLGRADFQVKLRGFRIELGEVESALRAFPGVREAAVVVREDVPGDRRLVGYVAADAELDVGALRSHLQQRLPDYMVPGALARLESLPLTANGKLDRAVLPAPDAPVAKQTYVAPRDDLEQQVADLWAEVLHVERVGVHDNFFDLGGHSLLATQVLTRIRTAFGVDLPLRGLFEQPTVEGMTQLLLESLADQVDASDLEGLVDALE